LFQYYVYVHFAWKGRPENDLYCVTWDVKPYSFTHSLWDWEICNPGIIFLGLGIQTYFLHWT